MANNRIFYAVQAVGLGSSPTPSGSIANEGSGFRWMKGVQSVGITTNFNLEQAFELGQLEIYQNIENVPEIEVTIEKVIDGRHLLYLQAVGQEGTGNIVAAADKSCDVWLAIFPDTDSAVTGSGPEALVYGSGMKISNIAYTFPVDGNSTESITLVGSDKLFYAGTGYGGSLNTGFAEISAATPHSPIGKIARRQHFSSASSVLPTEVSGAIRNGVGNIQNISISADFGRDNIFELGSFRPYYKFATYPIAITCDFEVVSISGDRVQASGNGTNLPDTNNIKVVYITNPTATTAVESGLLQIDLGSKNKLTSVNYTGGDTGGGNASVTYSYQTFNKFLVTDSYASATGTSGASGKYWL